MKKIYLSIAILLVLCLQSKNLLSQNISISQYEDSIRSVIAKMMLAKNDSERFELNNLVDKMFGEVLKDENTFSYPFEKVKNISRLGSEDGMVKLYNWNLPLENGEYRYYAYIQHFDKKHHIELYRLEDKSETIKNPEFIQLSENNWYGALYYKLLTKSSGKTIYYTLLGWDGNNNFTNKKIVETFFFQGKKLILGPPIYKMEQKIQNLLIFEFGEQVKMMLRNDEKLDMIVFDHLAPSQKKFEGQYMYYGPDMSQDGIQFKNGFWEYKANLDLRNVDTPIEKPVIKSDKLK